MAAPRIIVVGGGLAGLAAVIKIAEAGGTVDLFSIVPVKRSHSVCAQGGINAAKNLKGEGDTTDQALRRHDLRRRLSCQPDAGEGDVRGRAGHYRSAGPHGRAVQSHAGGPARFSPLWRHALQSHGVCRRHHRAAVAVRARRAGAPLRGRGQGEEVRGLGVSFRRTRLEGAGARHHGAESAHDGAAVVSRPTPSFWRPAALGRSSARAPTPWSARGRRSRRSSSRALTTRTASSSRCIPRRFRARTSCG